MGRDIAHLIQDALREIAFIKTATAAHTPASYQADGLVRRAVERALLTISEVIRGIPADVLKTQPQVPWPQIKGIGNIIRHEYHRIAPALIWSTLTVNLPDLERALRQIRRALPKS